MAGTYPLSRWRSPVALTIETRTERTGGVTGTFVDSSPQNVFIIRHYSIPAGKAEKSVSHFWGLDTRVKYALLYLTIIVENLDCQIFDRLWMDNPRMFTMHLSGLRSASTCIHCLRSRERGGRRRRSRSRDRDRRRRSRERRRRSRSREKRSRSRDRGRRKRYVVTHFSSIVT